MESRIRWNTSDGHKLKLRRKKYCGHRKKLGKKLEPKLPYTLYFKTLTNIFLAVEKIGTILKQKLLFFFPVENEIQNEGLESMQHVLRTFTPYANVKLQLPDALQLVTSCGKDYYIFIVSIHTTSELCFSHRALSFRRDS